MKKNGRNNGPHNGRLKFEFTGVRILMLHVIPIVEAKIAHLQDKVAEIRAWIAVFGDKGFFNVVPFEISYVMFDYLCSDDLMRFRLAGQWTNTLVTSYIAEKLRRNTPITDFLDIKVNDKWPVSSLLGITPFELGIQSLRTPVPYYFMQRFGIHMINTNLMFKTATTRLVCVSLLPRVKYYLVSKEKISINSDHHNILFIEADEHDLQEMFTNAINTNAPKLEHSPLLPFNTTNMIANRRIVKNGETPYPNPCVTTFGDLRQLFGHWSVINYVDTYEDAVARI